MQDIVMLVVALEFILLAIVQAAAYIDQNSPRCSVPKYIEKFQKTDRSKTSLLTYDAGHLRRDRDAKNSIITTWQISFDQIQQERSSAVDLLSLMSFFDDPDIPEGLLRNRAGTGNRHSDLQKLVSNNDGLDEEESGSEIGVTDDFKDDIMMLRNFSVSVNIDNATFGMQRLVQSATRNSSVLFADIANTNNGGVGATADQAAAFLIGCKTAGGSLGVVYNASNAQYSSTTAYIADSYTPSGILIKIVYSGAS